MHEITYSLFLIFWHQFCDVIYPPKSSSSKNKKHAICKNDMFLVNGKFSRNGMKIKEVEAYSLALLHVFLTGMHANKFATDARRYVVWGRGSLGF